MIFLKKMFLCFFVLAFIAGCAKTKVTERDQYVKGQLPRPETIWIYDFSATAADLPVHTGLDLEALNNDERLTDKEIAHGRKLGTIIGTELVNQLRNMGMSAEHATSATSPKVNDLVIEGYLLSFEEGDAKKRVVVGLKAGTSELNVAVEGFQMTPEGLRVLGSGKMDAEGGKTPGAAIGGLSWLATHNPAGFIVSTGMHAYGEKTGSSKVEGRARQTAEEIADQLEKRFKEQGWL